MYLAPLPPPPAGHAQAFVALRDSEAMDLQLLSSSSLEACVSATLQQAMRVSLASLCCFLRANEATSQLEVMGLPEEPPTILSLREDRFYPLSAAALLRKTIRVADHLASPLALSSSLSSAFPWWRHVRNSLSVPVLRAGGAGGLLGVLVMANKKDAIFRGFDDVDAKLVEQAARKLTLAMETMREREEAEQQLRAEQALTCCCSDMLIVRNLRELQQLVQARAPAVLLCETGRVLVAEEGAQGNAPLLRTLTGDEEGKDVTIHVPPFLEGQDQEEKEVPRRRGKQQESRRKQESRVGLWLRHDVADHSLWLSGLLGPKASKEKDEEGGEGQRAEFFLAPVRDEGQRLQALLLVQWQRRKKLDEQVELRVSRLLSAFLRCAQVIAEREETARRAEQEAKRLRKSQELQQVMQQVVASSSAGEVRSVLQAASRRLVQAVRVDVYSVREGGERLVWHDLERTGEGRDLELLLPCDGLVGLAASSRACVRVTDASSHPHFLQLVDQRSGRCRPKDLLCMPILSPSSGRAGLLHGVLQLTNKAGGRGFDEEDELAARQLAEMGALVMEKEDVQSGRGRLLQALCRIGESLQLSDVLKNVLAASWTWGGDLATEIEVWMSPASQPLSLVLVGRQESGREACVKFKEEDWRSRVCKDEEVLEAARESKLSMVPSAADPSVSYINLPIRLGEQRERSERRGLIRMRCSERGQQAVDSSSLTLLGEQAVRAIRNAEALGEAKESLQRDLQLFRRAEKISRCRSSIDLFKTTCAIASEVVQAEQVSLFAVDEEGRHIKEEISSAGQVSQSSSPSYRLKHRVAILVLQAMNDSGSFLAEEVGEEEGGARDAVMRKHCCGTPLWKSGGGGGGGEAVRHTRRREVESSVCVRPELIDGEIGLAELEDNAGRRRGGDCEVVL
uniref:GAF domain-containing protein n=1 Tax=Hanusia phi TaxID=3032 RepID=A0A7S0E9N8_9CRYP|mmetsp:Transcript_18403/g.41905  ORF Transcript_18403/g.41905 Transcript_18403/m.41905 type:complete len:909 (+) Transcript_18403:183-2909(+)